MERVVRAWTAAWEWLKGLDWLLIAIAYLVIYEIVTLCLYGVDGP